MLSLSENCRGLGYERFVKIRQMVYHKQNQPVSAIFLGFTFIGKFIKNGIMSSNTRALKNTFGIPDECLIFVSPYYERGLSLGNVMFHGLLVMLCITQAYIVFIVGIDSVGTLGSGVDGSPNKIKAQMFIDPQSTHFSSLVARRQNNLIRRRDAV